MSKIFDLLEFFNFDFFLALFFLIFWKYFLKPVFFEILIFSKYLFLILIFSIYLFNFAFRNIVLSSVFGDFKLHFKSNFKTLTCNYYLFPNANGRQIYFHVHSTILFENFAEEKILCLFSFFFEKNCGHFAFSFFDIPEKKWEKESKKGQRKTTWRNSKNIFYVFFLFSHFFLCYLAF